MSCSRASGDTGDPRRYLIIVARLLTRILQLVFAGAIPEGCCMLRPILIVLLTALATPILQATDIVELKSGKQIQGKVLSETPQYVEIEIDASGRKIVRKYPTRLISEVRRGTGTESSASSGAMLPKRTEKEVLQLIETTGGQSPDWLDSTPLRYPKTLDLSWPKPPKGPWNNSINVGQFIWDRVNPNPGQWRNGVKLMHHIMTVQSSDREVVQRAMISLGTMYHNLFEDYARAAYWWQKAGVDRGQGEPHAMLHLANCYFRLGSKELAKDMLGRMTRRPLGVIKLLGDLGETDLALRTAEASARGNSAVMSYLYAGDVCRVAGRLDEAEQYYRKALAASDNDKRNKNHAQRDRGRAQASLAALQFFRLSPKDVADGTYSASSLGYEDQVAVQVTVRDGIMTSIQVTKHREKQFYSSIEDTPRNLLARQAFAGVDTTSGATITSEAIINATAKALAQGQR